jgi:4'-phosphopantetheinyl transferase EntD
MTSGIAAAARQLFPPDVAVAALDPRAPCAALLPAEALSIAGAVPHRRREFTAGRAAARLALAGLGFPARPIPSGHDRAPIWPEGIVGSVAHTATVAVAATARAATARSLGIDAEPAVPLPPPLMDTVCTAPELAWLAAEPAARRGLLATLIFSAKECAYKAQYPLTRTLCGFDAMRVEIDLAAGAWRALFLRPVSPFAAGDAIAGRFLLDRGLILTGAALSAPPRRR